MSEAKYICEATIDIEARKPINGVVAIGAVVVRRRIDRTDEPTIIKKVRFCIDIPSNNDTGFYDPGSWQYFWKKYPEIIALLKENKNCVDANDLIRQFYNWWNGVVEEHEREYPGETLTIVSDNPAFDIGNLDQLIGQEIENGLSLTYRKIGVRLSYVSIFDTNSIVLLFERYLSCVDKRYLALLNRITEGNPYEHSHDPVEDAKSMAWNHAKITNFVLNAIQSYAKDMLE